ncbi:MAG: PPOX class F420-dependent oxidoreductase [Gaiellaceae bacterium]
MVGSLSGARYISLTTFRKDGSAVSTPVWVVSDDGRRLLVWTGTGTWKAKRIRRDPRVLVAVSGMRGRERGERIEGLAHIVDGVDVKALIREKYGWQMRLLERFSRGEDTSITIEIVDR